MARVIAIANQKGGVGKTTTAVNLAASLAAAEQKILLVDGDPQGNATSGVGVQKEQIRSTVYDVIIGDGTVADATVHSIHFKHLDVVPATPDLAGAEVELVDRRNRDRMMRNAVAEVQAKYDFVLIDCPPSLGTLTQTALSASTEVLMPIQCEYFAMEGLTQMIQTIKNVMHRFPGRLEFGGILLTMYDAALELTREVDAEVRDFFGGIVFANVIPRDVAAAEAPSHGRCVMDYAPRSRAARAYIELCMEVQGRE